MDPLFYAVHVVKATVLYTTNTMPKVAKYVSLAALFAILFLPLYVANESFFPFITGKGFAFRILVEIALVGAIVLAIVDKRYRPQFSWLLALFAGFTAWVFIADLFAVNAHKALWSNFERMDGFVTLIHLFVFFLVAGTVLTVDKLWRAWWLTFLAVAALVCGYAVLQLLGGLTINQGGVRVDGTFGNAIYLAVYLMFAAFIAVWQAFESKGWLRYGLLALAALSIIILFNTATRGAIVATVAGSMLAALIFAVRSGKRTRTAAVGILVTLLVVVGGFFLIKDQPAIATHPIWSRVASISLSELSVRFTLWSMAAEGVAERPVLGYGQEGYNYIFNGHYRPELYTQEPWFDRAHSVYVDWLVAGGVPALLLFIALLISAFLILFRAPNLTTAERIMLTSVLAAYALQAIVVFDNLFSYIPLAAVLAYLHGRAARPIERLVRLPELKGGQAEAILIPSAGAALLFLVLTVNMPNMQAAHHLVYAISPLPGGPAENMTHFREAFATNTFATQEVTEQLVTYTLRVVTDPAASNALKNEYATLAISSIEHEVEQAPQDARMRMQAALLYRFIGDYPRALAHIEAAELHSPNRQMIMLEHVSVLVAAGQKEEAVALLAKIYDESPRIPNLSVQVAAGFIAAGDTVRGEAILQETFGNTVIDHEALVAAYANTKQYEKLIAVLKLQVENQVNNPSAHYRLASAYALAGRISEARQQIQATMARFPQTAAQGKAFLESL